MINRIKDIDIKNHTYIFDDIISLKSIKNMSIKNFDGTNL